MAPDNRPPLAEQHTQHVIVVLLELRGVLRAAMAEGERDEAEFFDLRERAYEALGGFLRNTARSLELSYTPPEVLLDGRLLRATRAAYEAAYDIGRMLEELGATGLSVQPELSEAEFAEVLEAFARAKREHAPFASPTEHFRLHEHAPLYDVDVDLESPEYVGFAYAASVVAMRELLQQAGSTASLPPRAKRVAHGLIDLASESPALLLSAALARPLRSASEAGLAPQQAAERAAEASVQRAVLAIGLMQQLTADRGLTSHVVMAALLLDLGALVPDPSADPAQALPQTVAEITALGLLNEASVVRAAVAFETVWLTESAALGPVYQGQRLVTLAAQVLSTVHALQRLEAAHPSVAARLTALQQQVGEDEIMSLLVRALATALQAEDAWESAPTAAPAPLAPSGAAPSDAAVPGGESAAGAARGEDQAALPVAALSEHDRPTQPPMAPLRRSSERSLAALAEAAGGATASWPPAGDPSGHPADDPELTPSAPHTSHSVAEHAPPPDEPLSQPLHLASAPKRPPSAQGSLSGQPVPHVLLYALDNALTGTLLLEEPAPGGGNEMPLRHYVYLLNGAPAQAHLQRRASRLGDVLGRLRLARAARIQEIAEQPHAATLLGERLVAENVISREELQRALEAQLVERLALLSGLRRDATYAFYKDENLIHEVPGASQLIPTSPLNALFATLRGGVAPERIQETLRRIWRIPLVFHEDADRRAYALTGEEETVLERIERGRPTLDELLADPRVSKPVAQQLVYFLAITRQLSWRGQRKGPLMPRGSRPRTAFLPPLPPRTETHGEDAWVLSASQRTKLAVRPREDVAAAAAAAARGGRAAGSDAASASSNPPPRWSVAPPSIGPVATSSVPAEALPSIPPARAFSVTTPTAPPPQEAVEGALDASVQPTPAPSEASTPLPSSAQALGVEALGPTNIIEPAPALEAWAAGMRLLADGQREAALSELQRARRLDPEEPEYALRAAAAGAEPLSLAALEELGVRLPEHVALWIALGERCEQEGQLGRAAECFRRVLRLDLANAHAAEGVARLRRQGVH